MKKFFIAFAVMTSMIIFSSNSFAADMQNKSFVITPSNQRNFPDMSEQKKAEMEKRRAEIDKRLNVTEEQKTQLKAIHEKAKTEIMPKTKQLRDIEQEMRVMKQQQINKGYGIATLENFQLSGKSFEQLKNEQKSLKEEIHKIKKIQFEESQKVFTEEQKKELEKMRQEHEKKMKAYEMKHTPIR